MITMMRTRLITSSFPVLNGFIKIFVDLLKRDKKIRRGFLIITSLVGE